MTKQKTNWNLKIETRLFVFLYRWLGWLVGTRYRLLLLTTTGRKSQRKRTVPVLYMRYDGNYVVTASNIGSDKHPGWYINCRDNPHARIQIGRRQVVVLAQESSAEERERLWAMWLKENPRYQFYQEKTARKFPIVILKPVKFLY